MRAPRSRGSVAGWSSLAARRAHNPKVVGSNPTPATTYTKASAQNAGAFFVKARNPLCWLSTNQGVIVKLSNVFRIVGLAAVILASSSAHSDNTTAPASTRRPSRGRQHRARDRTDSRPDLQTTCPRRDAVCRGVRRIRCPAARQGSAGVDSSSLRHHRPHAWAVSRSDDRLFLDDDDGDDLAGGRLLRSGKAELLRRDERPARPDAGRHVLARVVSRIAGPAFRPRALYGHGGTTTPARRTATANLRAQRSSRERRPT